MKITIDANGTQLTDTEIQLISGLLRMYYMLVLNMANTATLSKSISVLSGGTKSPSEKRIDALMDDLVSNPLEAVKLFANTTFPHLDITIQDAD